LQSIKGSRARASGGENRVEIHPCLPSGPT
jgi:hypothetical protein